MINQWLNGLTELQVKVNPVVSFDCTKDLLLQMDFTESNTALTKEILNNTTAFSQYVNACLTKANARYGIGGYNEHRTIYSRSNHFDTEEEPRRLHLGIDIWGNAGTAVMAPLNAIVHSFAFNNYFGDYGATIILQHEIEGFVFFSLYGHLSLVDIDRLYEGKPIAAGEVFAHLGEPEENGYWPPHLHMQLIKDMQGMKGDYPGVCRYSERESYLHNCPDPDILLQMMQYAK